MQRKPTFPRVLAVNGGDPTVYRRFEAIGHPLPITFVRISTGPCGRWIDTRIDHLPTTADELEADRAHMVALLDQLSRIVEHLAGIPPAEAEPTRPNLRLVQDG